MAQNTLLDRQILETLASQNGNSVVGRATQYADLRHPDPVKAWLLDWLGPQDADIRKGSEYETSPWIYACLNQWAKLSSVPFVLRKRTGFSETNKPMDITSGPIWHLIHRPNSRMSTQEFLSYTLLHLGSAGNFFWLKNGGSGKIDGSTPLFLDIANPNSMTIRPDDIDKSGKVFRYTQQVSKKDVRKIPIELVVHGKLPNPFDQNWGMCPLNSLRITIDADYAARLHNKSQMKNRGRIEGIVKYNPDYSDENSIGDYKRVFDEAFSGGENAGKWVHSSGIDDLIQLSQSMRDMDWLEGQKLSREEICGAFGVPPPVVGVLDRATYTNYDQAALAMWTETLIPLGKLVECIFNREFVDEDCGTSDMVAQFDFLNGVKVIRDDREKKIKNYIDLVSKGEIAPAQAAEIVDLNIGQIQEIHKTVLIPFNMVPAEAVLQGGQSPSGPATPPSEPAESLEPATPAEPETNDEGDSDAKSILNALDQISNRLARIESKDKVGNDAQETLRGNVWRTIIAERAPFEKRMSSAMKKMFHQQRTEVLKEIDAFAKDHKEKPLTPGLGEQLMGAIFVVAMWREVIKNATKSVLDSAYAAGARSVLEELGLPPDQEVPLNAWRSQQDVLLESINGTTKERLSSVREILEEGIAAEDAIEDIAERMSEGARGVFRMRESERMRIARTEVDRAFSGSRFMQMKEAGINRHEWLPNRDDLVRPSHVSLDGEIRTIGTPFSNGLLYPLDPAGSAQETVNCRCVTVMAVNQDLTTAI